MTELYDIIEVIDTATAEVKYEMCSKLYLKEKRNSKENYIL